MILDLLMEIEKIKQQDGKSIMQPANVENIAAIKEWIAKSVMDNVSIEEYEKLLNLVNGIEFNGLVIYNADLNDENNGFIAANEIWRENEWESNYLFFGDANISWYCLDVDKRVYLELDKPSGEVLEKYINFQAMVTEAIKNVL
ncbi:YrhA family protein [Metabacillus sp. 84]|uniref:YrhA family protein n=1 Tax=Metabacillus sp. 84 TaxID=3404705 RepID=UPI003CEE2F7E